MSDNAQEAIRKERLVKNEMAFRDYNNRRVALEQEATDDHRDHDTAPFVCECGSADCVSAMMATVGEYETAHSAPDRFMVKPDHIYRDVEHVIEQHDHYWIVEKYPGEIPVS